MRQRVRYFLGHVHNAEVRAMIFPDDRNDVAALRIFHGRHIQHHHVHADHAEYWNAHALIEHPAVIGMVPVIAVGVSDCGDSDFRLARGPVRRSYNRQTLRREMC